MKTAQTIKKWRVLLVVGDFARLETVFGVDEEHATRNAESLMADIAEAQSKKVEFVDLDEVK